MAQRVKGQEVETIILIDSVPQDSLSYARSIEMTFKTEIKEEGYLGETTQRYDTIFNGLSGKVTYHYDSPDIFNLITAVVDKAKRRTPGTRINVKATINFPSGRRARVVIKDVEFGPLPVSFGGRADYGELQVDFAASDAVALVA